MITALKIIIMLVAVFALSYPFICVRGKLSKFFVASRARYYHPHNKKNVFFVVIAILEYVVVLILFGIFDGLMQTLASLPLLGRLFSSAINGLNSHVDYVVLAIKMLLINLVIVYAFLIIKLFVKKAILNPIFNIGNGKKPKLGLKKGKKKKKKGEEAGENESLDSTEGGEELDDAEEKVRKRRRIPDFVHSLTEDDGVEDGAATPKESEGDKDEPHYYGPVSKFILSLFFDGLQFEYARPWVMRARMILTGFIRLVEVWYLLVITVTLASVFFPLPEVIYDLFINVLHVGEWYIYPAISIIFLQEICNVFDTIEQEEKIKDVEKEEEKKEDTKRDARIRALLAELKKRFDAEHSLRYYPEMSSHDIPEYKCTNLAYASALDYIRKQMENTSGRVVQSYMECLDAIYNDAHVYFSASFYSELGEYLIAYTYIRLLSGSRMVFMVSDEKEKETLRTYINDRLMKMTGSSAEATWRVYTADERLDQADVLIATPADFSNDDIVEHYPAFFEEVCNAVFIDSDKMVATDSYLCPIISTRLKKATNGRIRFVFLSLDIIKGFAARNLPKLFCVDKVLSFSSARENESVSYVLWNKESKKRRIYNKSGQRTTCLETIIAEQAFKYGMDGVRVITEAPLEHADCKMLALHDVEINNLYKNIVDVNYMIYSDDRCNLSAALYACTRFRGRKRSVVHILSKPYLLREYFMYKANTEDYINRSSFIQPRVTEHVDNHKLSLLKVFCDLTADGGLRVQDFERRMRVLIATHKERGDYVSSVFCKELIKTKAPSELKLSELAAYLVAGLCDNDPEFVPESEIQAYVCGSVGNKAKDFYLVIDPVAQDNFALTREKKIVFNRTKEVFSYVFACNKRVELRLNDEVIGLLDTFPDRVHLEYVEGQSIIYRNSEYEIEHISEDGSTIYLRHENISIKNCLDTVLLRKYELEELTPTGKSGLLNNSTSDLEEIGVELCKAKFTATTYGFYGLTTDKQTLDFYHGVEGNPHISNPNVRKFQSGNVLRVTLSARTECTDGMRRLLAAVFNEFIRTIFPRAYRCVAICPILAEPIVDKNDDRYEDSALNRIKTLYPFINDPSEEFIESDPKRMQFLFINDCAEDIGVLDWFFDPSGRYMQEFLANVYSYLHWLKLRPNKAHYIYFGGESLPECYDLEGCCELLKDFNLILSDDGEKDFETAGEDVQNDKIELCSFCHKPMESGRFSFFDKHRYICADCFETVDDEEQLGDIYISMREYLANNYPEITFGSAKVKFDHVYDLTLEQILSEFYSRMDFTERTIYVEADNPINNVRVSVLRGIISLWQADSSLINHYASAQLYFEELRYLRSIGENESADWVYNAIPYDIKAFVDEINDYVSFKDKATDQTDAEESGEEGSKEGGEENITPQDTSAGERRTSFSFMVVKNAELKTIDDDVEDPTDEDYSDDLYDPNKIPRFWKRYLRGEHLDDGSEEDVADAANHTEDDEDADDSKDPEDANDALVPNAPPEIEDQVATEENETDEGLNDTDGSAEDAPSADDEKKRKREEKKRQKEEKKRLKEEKKRQKQLERENNSKESDNNKDGTGEENGTKKRGWFFGFKKSKHVEDDKKDENDSSNLTDDSSDDTSNEDQNTDSNKNKKDKKSKKTNGKRSSKLSAGEKILPHEDDEKTNPKIRLYNDLVRAAYNYSEDFVSREGVTDKELNIIFQYVSCDYPELFWLHSYAYTPTTVAHRFRCKDANGRLDIKQINKKRAEMRKGAKMFTKGITRKTDPYQAVLTIYRRLILTLDYDSAGLDAHIDRDKSRDDSLRSLYNALVHHKVVCAGYAVAMQYLLQSVGIVCGYVVSDDDATGGCHAFNILKIGKYCYYLDATWGDWSKTTNSNYKDLVLYDYFCTPYKEFLLASPDSVADHRPRKEYYPNVEEFNYTNHEYYRYHNAYLKSYNEQDIIRIFAETALSYDKDEMGRFKVSFRCSSGSLAKYVVGVLSSKGKIFDIISKARAEVQRKSKKAAKLLECESVSHICKDTTGVVTYFIESTASKVKNKK